MRLGFVPTPWALERLPNNYELLRDELSKQQISFNIRTALLTQSGNESLFNRYVLYALSYLGIYANFSLL